MLKKNDLIVVFLIFITIVFLSFCGFVTVRGNSMYPTFSEGDNLFYSRLIKAQREDIVLAKVDGVILIKRVAGIAGDKVAFSENSVEVKTDTDSLAESYTMVKEGYYFLVGDNLLHSIDSRNPIVGQIPQKNIIGVYVIRIPEFITRRLILAILIIFSFIVSTLYKKKGVGVK